MLEFPHISLVGREIVRGTRTPLGAAVMAAALFSAGCHKKPAKVFIPPVVQRPAPEPLKVPDIQPPDLASTEVEPEPALIELGDQRAVAILPPPAPPAVTPPPRRPQAAVPKPPVQPTPPEPSGPKIVQLFPADQQRAYNKELDDILSRDQTTLETVARRNLNNDMRDRMAAIRELLAQAKQAREQDLLTAVNLARRADTLAKDLLTRLP